jgi:hypothetical protein
MSKLTNIKKYAAQWLKYTGLNDDDISKEIKVSLNELQEMWTELTNNTAESKSTNLMITHTAGKKVNSVAIMTKEASEVVDAGRNKPAPIRDQKGIFRPKQK